MKKVLALLVTLTLAILLGCTVLAATSYDSTYTYTDEKIFNGIVDRTGTANTEKVTFKSQTALKVIPNPEKLPETEVILDHYSLHTLNFIIKELRFISVYCYYDGTGSAPTPYLHIMPQNRGQIQRGVMVYPFETLQKGAWQWLTFDVGSELFGNVTSASSVLSQLHFYPYGDIKSGSLTADDVMYIAKMRFTSYDKSPSDIVARYPVSFQKSRQDVFGTDPETVLAAVGQTVTIPQNPYTREGYDFTGWICSADSQVYQPGSTYTVTERTRSSASATTSSKYVTGEALFFPDWQFSGKTADALPNQISAPFTNFFSNVLSGDKSTYQKNYEFQGRNVLKFNIDNSTGSIVAFDCWDVTSLPFNLDKYKYAVISYYLETSSDTAPSVSPILRLLTNGGALTSEYRATSSKPLEANKWSVMCFDFSAASSYFNGSSNEHILKQLHVFFSGTSKATIFASGDTVYVDKITLLATVPDSVPVYVQPVPECDEDGRLYPNDIMTRAEAVQLLYDIIRTRMGVTGSALQTTGFSDIKSTDSFYTAVTTLERFGLLSPADKFRPSEPFTKADVALIAVNIMNGIGKKQPQLITGTDIPMTRAELATFIYDLFFAKSSDGTLESAMNVFTDVSYDHWSYPAMTNLSIPRFSSYGSDGKENVIIMMKGESYGASYNTLDGLKKIRELNVTEKQRIEEIRGTESVYSTYNGGKVYYVSSSVASSGTGNSEDSPIKVSTLKEVSSKISAKAGDVILFKRGDTFRGQLSTVVGVTYSAYGEGDKPLLTRSPQNYADASLWKLLDGTSNIWVLEDIPGDAGTIVINNGEITGLKEIPSLSNGEYVVRGNASKIFDVKTELDKNYEFLHHNIPTSGTSVSVSQKGTIYFRCDEGNPGELFQSIELNINGALIGARSNVTIDNLCLKYFGAHGVSAGTIHNLTVTNCEIGWGGGSIQYYGGTGAVVRYGNGVEIYGALMNYTVENCYVYQIYDAGVTHQISSSSAGNFYMENTKYINNLLCDSTYNIEYFMSKDDKNEKSERFMKDVLIEGNILRRSGYGWGRQRPDHAPASIKGWSHHNTCYGFVIRGNIIDRCYSINSSNNHLMQLGSTHIGSAPYLDGNLFIQVPLRSFALHGNIGAKYTATVNAEIARIGGKDNVALFCPEDGGKDE